MRLNISKDINSVDAMCYNYTINHSFSVFLAGLLLKHTMGESVLLNSRTGVQNLYSSVTLDKLENVFLMSQCSNSEIYE